MEIKYPIYRQKFKVEVPVKYSTLPMELCFKVLSKRQILDLQTLYLVDDNQNHQYKINVLRESACENTKELIDLLSDALISSIFEKIIKYSFFDVTLREKFRKLFWLQVSDDLKGDSWNCEICKEKRLQQGRNCPMLESFGPESKDVQIIVNGDIYNSCPVYKFVENSELLNAAYSAYKMYDKGILPESGGMMDQTMFFVEMSDLVASLLKEREAKEFDKMKKE